MKKFGLVWIALLLCVSASIEADNKNTGTTTTSSTTSSTNTVLLNKKTGVLQGKDKRSLSIEPYAQYDASTF